MCYHKEIKWVMKEKVAAVCLVCDFILVWEISKDLGNPIGPRWIESDEK